MICHFFWVNSCVARYKNDTEFMAAFDGVGLHYPCTVGSEHDVGPELLAAGKVLWASEDLWSEADWPGAACWAKTFNQNFIRMNLTSTVAWSTVWSAYPKVDLFGGIHNATTRGDPGISADGYWGPGLMYAWQPWSGYYVVPPTVWASAHTTQFVEPGTNCDVSVLKWTSTKNKPPPKNKTKTKTKTKTTNWCLSCRCMLTRPTPICNAFRTLYI